MIGPTGTLAPRFGLFLGQAGKDWARILDEFSMGDELGFDHAWLVDHLTPTDGSRQVPILEAWTLLAAIAARTEAIGLGVLVTNNLFRNPALLLKQAVTVDRISGGRVILGLGAGWFPEEHHRYGFAFPAAAERVERLEEAVRLCRALLDGEVVTFRGRHYSVVDAYLAPRPVRGRLPILVAGHRPATIDIAARYADQWDTFPTIAGASTDGVSDDLRAQMRRFRAACRAACREPDTIRRSTWVGAEAVASPDDFVAFVRRAADIGFTDFTIGLPRDTGVLRDIALHVIPELRASMVGPAASLEVPA